MQKNGRDTMQQWEPAARCNLPQVQLQAPLLFHSSFMKKHLLVMKETWESAEVEVTLHTLWLPERGRNLRDKALWCFSGGSECPFSSWSAGNHLPCHSTDSTLKVQRAAHKYASAGPWPILSWGWASPTVFQGVLFIPTGKHQILDINIKKQIFL